MGRQSSWGDAVPCGADGAVPVAWAQVLARPFRRAGALLGSRRYVFPRIRGARGEREVGARSATIRVVFLRARRGLVEGVLPAAPTIFLTIRPAASRLLRLDAVHLAGDDADVAWGCAPYRNGG